MSETQDYIVRATAADGGVRAFAAAASGIVEQARLIHGTSPVASAALGRLLTAGAMMGVMMKGDDDILTVSMKGDGPINGMTVTADSKGNVKGYVGNPHVDIPLNFAGKLDVGAAIGYGTLSVIKDLGLKEPYCGQVPLSTSEVAEDLTYYFAASEQIPTSVALGVLVDRDCSIKQAGGFIIQMMPGADEGLAEKIEKRLLKFKSVTSMMEAGMTPENILTKVLGGFGLSVGERMPARYYCACSREKVERALLGAGKNDLLEMATGDENTEVNCRFCGKNYIFTPGDIKQLILSSAKQ